MATPQPVKMVDPSPSSSTEGSDIVRPKSEAPTISDQTLKSTGSVKVKKIIGAYQAVKEHLRRGYEVMEYHPDFAPKPPVEVAPVPVPEPNKILPFSKDGILTFRMETRLVVPEIAPTGLTLISGPPIKGARVIADIVLVHDLFGHPHNSWLFNGDQPNPDKKDFWNLWWHPIAREIFNFNDLGREPPTGEETDADGNPIEKVYWPTQVLAQDIPNARVFTWGYKSDVVKFFNPDAAEGSIECLATKLQDDILEVRQTVMERPVIFIAHSFGGLIVKKALTQFNTNRNHDGLVDSTKGIFFLSTPQARPKLDLYPIIERIMCQNRIMNVTFKEMASIKKLLHTNHHEFTNVRKDVQDHLDFLMMAMAHKTRSGGIKIYIFTEELKSPLAGFWRGYELIIKDKMARLDQENFDGPLPAVHDTLDLDHFSMGRYSSVDDPNYIKIKEGLRNILGTLPRVILPPPKPVRKRGDRGRGVIGVPDIDDVPITGTDNRYFH